MSMFSMSRTTAAREGYMVTERVGRSLIEINCLWIFSGSDAMIEEALGVELTMIMEGRQLMLWSCWLALV